jgi:cyclopropane fatty-acyl-phospholipid synthase-like methyltransferase
LGHQSVKGTFFESPQADEQLERWNEEFWRSLLSHIRADVAAPEVQCILDVGCHRGGLLEYLARHFRPERLLGLEPLATAREQASFRLKGRASSVQIMDPSRWEGIPSASVDLATSHEVLHLIGDLDDFMRSLARVVRPEGWAFVVLGCHRENPMWQHWKSQVTELGHEVFDHFPMDILNAASAAGFHTSVRPLRRDGWVIYDPRTAEFQYPSIAGMFEHQYRHKLLFRLIRRSPSTT